MSILPYETALEKLLSHVPVGDVVQVPLSQSLGSFLAAPVLADIDLPPFDKSVMDGYAVFSEDCRKAPARLQVVGIVEAGSERQPSCRPGQCVQVMTGAAVPPGPDAVVMVEKTRRLDEQSVEIMVPVAAGDNLVRAGCEVARGSRVLEPRRWIGPQELGVLATFGCQTVPVRHSPSAAIVATGNEIVPVGCTPSFGQIRNSNSHVLWAQCQRRGIEAEILPAVPDDPDQLRATLERALLRDLVIFTGGVSMGVLDFFPQVLQQENIEILFHKVAIKPGKPVLVARKGNHLIFGLPGNPVSSFVTFELFVVPAIRKWKGAACARHAEHRATLLERVSQKPGRTFFMPALTSFDRESGRFQARPVPTRGSADLVAFSRANSLAIVPADVGEIESGGPVRVLLLDKEE